MVHEQSFTIEELAEAAQVPVRTIRFYISEGLLSGPGTRGKGASYGEEHLLRLRLIRRLTEAHLPLAEIRRRLAHLSEGEVRALLAQEEQRNAEIALRAQASSPREYLSALLQQARAAREAAAYDLSLPAAQAREAALQLAPPAKEDDRGEVWERIALAPGVELHVRFDAREQQRRLIRRLLAAAGR
ncbi:MAG: MerR family transcriptional regulator [Anaerolineae bacterium]